MGSRGVGFRPDAPDPPAQGPSGRAARRRSAGLALGRHRRRLHPLDLGPARHALELGGQARLAPDRRRPAARRALASPRRRECKRSLLALVRADGGARPRLRARMLGLGRHGGALRRQGRAPRGRGGGRRRAGGARRGRALPLSPGVRRAREPRRPARAPAARRVRRRAAQNGARASRRLAGAVAAGRGAGRSAPRGRTYRSALVRTLPALVRRAAGAGSGGPLPVLRGAARRRGAAFSDVRRSGASGRAPRRVVGGRAPARGGAPRRGSRVPTRRRAGDSRVMDELDPLRLDRDVARAARYERTWWRLLRGDAERAAADAWYEPVRYVTTRPTFAAVSELGAGDPRRDPLVRWIHRLALTRIAARPIVEAARLRQRTTIELEKPERGTTSAGDLVHRALADREPLRRQL